MDSMSRNGWHDEEGSRGKASHQYLKSVSSGLGAGKGRLEKTGKSWAWEGVKLPMLKEIWTLGRLFCTHST